MPEITPLRAGDPDRLGPYRLIGLLGEGGQGSVFLGEESAPAADQDHEDGRNGWSGEGARRVAIKLLHARLSGDAKARSRFAAELRVARRVAAFCTARILDSDVEGDRPYIVSEYIDGPPLAEVLATEGPRSGADLDRLAIGTMTALAAIHQAGVVHRDFKPANVLLAPDGPRVIDFGIARALDATGTVSSTAVGTPAYMAPEQISGAPVGPQADVFAWGTTMIYAATGRPAFGQDSIPAVMHRILNFPPDLGSLGEPLRGLVQACLTKQAAHRPSSQQVLLHLLHLAGSLPQDADGGAGPLAPEVEPAAIINHGAEVVSTQTAIRLASVPGGTPPTPSPSPAAPPYPQPPQPQPRNGWTPPPPTPPYQQLPGQPQPQWGPPSTWPRGPDGQSTGPGKGSGTDTGAPRRGRGIGVLAGAGSAALVALVVLVTVIAVQVLGDGDRGGDGGPGRTGGRVRMALDNVLSTGKGLSPSHATFGTERFVAKQVFTGLVEFAPNGTLRNRLASKITPSPGCASWKIDVPTATTFSNGERVSAASFVRGWTRAAQVRDGLAATLIGGIRGFDDVSSGKRDTITGLRSYGTGIEVDLTSPDCEFPRRLADPMLSPVPSNAGGPDNAAYNDMPIGNGPFKIESYVKDRSITLVRNDAWVFGKAKLDRVEIDLTTDAAAKARTGFAGGLYEWAPLDVAALGTTRGDPARISRPLQGLNYLIPLTARGPMASAKARLAVSYALDRKAISSSLYGGAYPAATGIVPSTISGFGRPGTCPSCERRDPERAKRLAQEASLGPGTKVRLYVRNTPSQQRWTEMVQDQLRSVLGWTIERRVTADVDLRTYAADLTAEDAAGLAAFAWRPDYPSAHAMLRPLLAGHQAATADNGLFNFSGWRDAGFDRLINESVKTPDENTRLTRLREAEKIALDQMALIPVVFTGSAALRSGKLVGLDLDYAAVASVGSPS